jgi:hypothetical protein
MVSLGSSTKTAISDKALPVYSKRIFEYERVEPGWQMTCIPSLVSVQMDSVEMDLSTYENDDLTFLIRLTATIGCRATSPGEPLFPYAPHKITHTIMLEKKARWDEIIPSLHSRL